ncbi:Vacuolar protein sorting-associated protein 27 [Choanephora cucurbitarum]|uniref:Vacuolar protein sorting-associated protein 27 n=1 Tax=Choanephora cucurbitarum TaxID=101091 RepID=A0A1C7N8G2_9FUNG|nr:Vacuolar protein sorting-associated protein 27 [Choanephora cucurbitarum]
MSWWGQSAFEETIEKATSELLPGGQEDLVLNLDISDQIRSKKVNAKDAMRLLKKRLSHANPNVQLATLSLVDTCVKNGGDLFVREIASREFMDELVLILRRDSNPEVRNKILSIIQTWGLASKNKPTLSYMYDTYALLKAEGTSFPPVDVNADSILLETAAAPEWSDSDVCDRCRTPFTLTNRKHHCRNCGGTFCQQCSAKTMPLPKLGINESVRVCDGCYIKLKLEKASVQTATPKPAAIPPPSTNQTEDSDHFDDDMKRAIELSLKEAEQSKNSYGAGYVAPKEPEPQRETAPANDEEDDADLAAAIAASLRDLEIAQQPTKKTNTNELSSVEMENILLFSTLMDRVYASGGDVSNDTQINQLYTQIGTLQPKLVKNLNETIQKRNAFIELHEKLNMAVRAYDRLLEERLRGVRQQPSTYYLPEQQYQPQPLYHQAYYQPSPQQQQQQQQQPSAYYPTPSPHMATPTTPSQDYTNQQDMSQYYSAPPHYQLSPQVTDQHAYPQPQQQQQQQQPYPQQPQQPQQQHYTKPIDEAPLIDL